MSRFDLNIARSMTLKTPLRTTLLIQFDPYEDVYIQTYVNGKARGPLKNRQGDIRYYATRSSARKAASRWRRGVKN